jgi:hypothetical protein
MYYTCMFGMVRVVVCMKEIMTVFVQMGKGTIFSVFVIMPMVMCMKIVIMLVVGILIMVMAVSMGSGITIMVV